MIEEDFTELVAQPIQFRKLWNCCWGNEAAVIVFDNGSRHAVCKNCAMQYTGEIQWDLDELGLAFHNWVAEPREAGDVCYSGYWMEHYVVLAKSGDGEFTVLWLGDSSTNNGDRVTTHRTAWDDRRDKLGSVSMFDGLDDPESGSFASYEEFLEIALDCASNATYVNEILN